MGLEHLKVLKEKEYRIFLLLIIWFLIVFTIASFNPILEINIVLYIPLIAVCLILIIISVVGRKDIKNELTFKMFLKYAIISAIFIAIFFSLALVLLLLIVILSILTYIFITSLFTMHGVYNKGISFDEKLYKWPFPFNWIARTLVLGGGLLLSALIMFAFAGVATAWAISSEDIANFLAIVPRIMILIMIGLMGLSFLLLLIGKYNAWLGVFFLWTALYSIYLMIKAFIGVGGSTTGSSTLPLPAQIGLYVFDLYLVLGTIGSLVGKRADILASKMESIPLGKFMKPDSIILALIFSKVSYEFANSIPGLGVSSLKATAVFVLFVPLFLFFGLYGIYNYGNIKKKWKEDKKREKQKRKKKAKETIEKLTPRPSIDKAQKPSSQTPKIKENLMYCSKCGTPNDATTASFCKGCGSELKK